MSQTAEQLFIEAVERFYPRIRGRFVVLRNDRSVAEDLAQEVFARFWAQLSRGTPVRNTWAFLHRIMQNVGLEYLRKRKNRPQPMGQLLDPKMPSPADQVEHAEELERVAQLVRQLPPEERDLLFSWYVLELSGPEIAKAFGLPRRTALDRIYAAVAKVAGQMQADAVRR